VRRVIIAGPAHFSAVDGVALSSATAFATPLGPVSVDLDSRRQALDVPGVFVDDAAHAPEHSVEVHLPFLTTVLDDVSVLPLLVGSSGAGVFAEVLDRLWGRSETLVVISTDLSHYHDRRLARMLDGRTAEIICRRDAPAPSAACGAAAVAGMLLAARRHQLDVRPLDLRNSGDTTGSPERVVGYGAFALFEPQPGDDDRAAEALPVPGHVDVRAYAELNDFLPPALRGATMRRPFRSHQTVKDVIEAIGIPHTEVDLIVADGESVGFDHRPTSGGRIAVYPVFESLDIGPIGRLRPTPLRDPRFVVDINLGRLARLLRLLGFDATCDRHLDDGDLADIGVREHRIVLTRDRGLLKRKQITHGLFVRAETPDDQIVDVLRRLDLGHALAPFTRCLGCGGRLAPVSKADVLDELEPRTRLHYDEFARCSGCGQVYWKGSHHRRLVELVDRIAGELTPEPGAGIEPATSRLQGECSAN
jgi:AmmeMemoRadiSam system protein B